MKVEIKLQKDIAEPYAVIYTQKLTDDIQGIVDFIENSQSAGRVVTAMDEDKIIVINTVDIYMVRVEDDKAVIYCQNKKYISRKRLCELEKMLGHNFMRISKTTMINLDYISGVEPSFNGMMLLTMKNGCKDYISRRYLTAFKKYLGL